jgi:hypothetical protein
MALKNRPDKSARIFLADAGFGWRLVPFRSDSSFCEGRQKWRISAVFVVCATGIEPVTPTA